jgi:dienelactone hydrolase
MIKLIISFIAVLFLTSNATAKGETISYKINGEAYEGYYITPHKNAPFILLVHDWDGLTDYEIKRANMLADSGYAVFAADLFGKGIRPIKVVDKKQHTGELYKDRNKMRQLLKGAINKAKDLGADIKNGVAMGYCFGGAAVLELARSGENLKGFITFHGGLTTPHGQDYLNTKGEIVIFHGTADKMITMSDFSKLAEELEKSKIPHEMIAYGGAPHAFTVFDSKRYREDADKKSWDRFTKFLKEVF